MKQIKYGWRVPDFSTDGSDRTAFLNQMLANLAQVQDKFDSAWVADHFVPWASFQAVETDTIECMTTISYLAALFPRLDWGTIVLCQSYRNPALLAKMAANVHWFTGGRFIFGIGAGWKGDEYTAYGYDYPKASVRIAQLEETVQIVRKLWSTDPADQPTNFTGKYYQIQDAWCEPRPTPAPPIMIGAGGEQLALRVVAKHADWYNYPNGTVAEFTHKLDVLRSHCDAIGRDYDEIVKTWFCECLAVAATETEARRMAEAFPFYNPASAIVGTPEQVADQLRRFTALNVEHILLRFADFPSSDGTLRFAEEVMPLLESNRKN